MDYELGPDDYEVGDAKDTANKNNSKNVFGFFKGKNVTFILIIANISLFLFANILQNFDTRLDDVAQELTSYRIVTVRNGREVVLRFGRAAVFNYAYASSFPPAIRYENAYYRLLSATYQHGGFLHILINMFSLFLIGRFFESIYGKKRFFVIYTISGLSSTLISFISRSSFTFIVSVGASGSLFGLVGALLTFTLMNKHRLDPNFRRSLLNNLIFIIAINLFIGVSVQGIDNFGHVGGLIGGLAAALLIQPIVFLKSKEETSGMKLIFIFMVFLAAGSIITNYFYYFSGLAFKDVKSVFRKRANRYGKNKEEIPRVKKKININYKDYR